jgi:hypothetical protein
LSCVCSFKDDDANAFTLNQLAILS